MKRFLAFKGDVYYPGGGFDDFAGSFDTQEEAIAAASVKPTYAYSWWWSVWDTDGDAPIKVADETGRC